MVNSRFNVMSQEDRRRFFQISDFAEELNRRLFDIEELMTEVDNTTNEFAILQRRYQNLVGQSRNWRVIWLGFWKVMVCLSRMIWLGFWKFTVCLSSNLAVLMVYNFWEGGFLGSIA